MNKEIKTNLELAFECVKEIEKQILTDTQYKMLGHFLGVSQSADYPDFVFRVNNKLLGENMHVKLENLDQEETQFFYRHDVFKIKNGTLHNSFMHILALASSSRSVLATMSRSKSLLTNFLSVQNESTEKNVAEFISYHGKNPLNLTMLVCTMTNIEAIARVVNTYGMEKTVLDISKVETELDANRGRLDKMPDAFDQGRIYTYAQMAGYLSHARDTHEIIKEARRVVFAWELDKSLEVSVQTNAHKLKI